MKNKLSIIKSWLGTGSVNIFGLPMSGKDTQGQKLAELLGAKFLSSGDIIRQKETEARQDYSSEGNLIPTDVFYAWVLPYFYEPAIKNQPLVLSSIGRWFGEEDQVLAEAAESGHGIKAVIILDLSVADVESRFETAKILGDRGNRADDSTFAIMQNRIEEFSTKTLPVIQHYNDLGLLLRVNGDQPRDAVTAEIIEKLYKKASEEVA